MSELQVTARFKVQDGKLDHFKSVAKKCMESVQKKDRGTLQYDWFFKEDNNTCIVRERYSSSEAVLEHIGNLGETFGELLGVSEMALEVYGAPSEELAKATEGLDVTVYSHFQGL